MNKRTLKSMFIMATSSVIGYLISLYLTSYITENIGIEAYGFVSLSKTFANYGNIITVALTAFMVRYISVHYHRDEIRESLSYYVSSINASVILCVLLSFLFVAIVLNLEHIIRIPGDMTASVKILFFFVFFGFITTTLSTPFGIGFYIKNRLDLSGFIKILSYILEVIVLLILFNIFEPDLWFVGVGIFAAAGAVLGGSYIANKKLVPEFKYDKRLFSGSKVKKLLGNGIWNSINQLGNTLNSGLDLFVSNALLSGMQTGQIAIAKNIGTMFSMLSGIVFQPLQPQLLRDYSDGVNEKFLKTMLKCMKLCGLVGSLAFSGFFAIGMLFFRLWLPNQDTDILYSLTILTVFTYITDIFMQPIYYVSTLTVKNKIPCFITIVGGFLNVLGMYFLICYTSLGIYAVPITTVVIMFLINVFFNPVYACWCLKIKREFFYPLIIRHLLSTVAMCFVFRIIVAMLRPVNWLGFLLAVLILSVLGVLIYSVLMLNAEERTMLINKVLHVMRNRN